MHNAIPTYNTILRLFLKLFILTQQIIPIETNRAVKALK